MATDERPCPSWAPELLVSGQWTRNGLRFATEAEALASARELMMRWFAPTDARATPATEPVNAVVAL